PQTMQDISPPKLVAPLVAYLAHPDCRESGSLFEASAGSFKKVRWERSRGAYLDTETPITLQDIADHWSTITDFSASEHPDDMREALRGMWDRSLL
ncbi:MAG: serine/threonine protein kinase, partial [Pseudomonadota bacterium]